MNRELNRPELQWHRQEPVTFAQGDDVAGVVALGDVASQQRRSKLFDLITIEIANGVSESQRRRLRRRHQPMCRQLFKDFRAIGV